VRCCATPAACDSSRPSPVWRTATVATSTLGAMDPSNILTVRRVPRHRGLPDQGKVFYVAGGEVAVRPFTLVDRIRRTVVRSTSCASRRPLRRRRVRLAAPRRALTLPRLASVGLGGAWGRQNESRRVRG
jgi:hypothetical protein